ncbi:hypothetical protein [Calycomorphotria hydatis]|uniref:Tetratricopeptide repeat protein n=1 Tax=Calycomorphotria hydatis TaxID=2528027 RepID=A0A517T4P7_9PLAN|nr:hypothetical protein [Calycomorphotria hydatis]QDT63338.1 hypothetical protein V22_05590 [Calycomorphotria hydatis]
MMNQIIALSFVSLVMITGTNVFAQAVTVQQPAFGVSSLGTTVSVPDRGEAYLGGVKSARQSAGRSNLHPFSGRYSSDRSASSFVVRPYIHDLRAMDEMILNDAEYGTNYSAAYTKSPLEDATAYGMSRQYAGDRSQLLREQPAATAASTMESSSRYEYEGRLADKYFALGKQAEAKGRRGVAQLHFRMAAKYGHVDAERSLAAATTTQAAED